MTAKELKEQIKKTNCQRNNLARRLSKKMLNKEKEDSKSSTDSEMNSLDFSLSYIF